MNSKESILLIRLKSIGDVAFTLPAVNAVRDNFPDAKITFLTSKENAPLLRGFREVAETITLDPRPVSKRKSPDHLVRSLFAPAPIARREIFPRD